MSNMRVRITTHFVFCNMVFTFKLVGLLTVPTLLLSVESVPHINTLHVKNFFLDSPSAWSLGYKTYDSSCTYG